MFRWESCKGSVWKSVKKCLRLWSEAGTRDWISQVARSLQAARRCTRVKHVEKLNRHASCNTTWQKVQTNHSVSSRLRLATQSSWRPSRQSTLLWKNWLFAFLSHSSINTPYTHEILRASRKNFERETLEKTRLTHTQSSHSDSSNSSTLTLSIVTSLRGTLAKTFSHHTHICEKAF